MQALVADLRARLRATPRGGSRPRCDKHSEAGKLLARERIRVLLDTGSPFLELSQLAAHGVYGEDMPARGSSPASARIAAASAWWSPTTRR